jgi:REP element-mobilizing transposase RayT
MHTPGRGEGALRRHRASVPGSSYFLTLCVDRAGTALLDGEIATAIQREINAIESDGHWRIRAAVIMPDHLHLLIHLTGELPLPRCVARLKSKTRPSLTQHGLGWQTNFYEHRLRPDEPVEGVVRYIFLNPYRACLVSAGKSYPWFWLGSHESAWFTPTTSDGKPFPDWLR